MSIKNSNRTWTVTKFKEANQRIGVMKPEVVLIKTKIDTGEDWR